jgi:hypothetical protein
MLALLTCSATPSGRRCGNHAVADHRLVVSAGWQRLAAAGHPDFTVVDRDDFTVVHRDDFTVSDKTFRWVLTEEPNGGFKGSNGGFYNSVDEAKAELLAVGLRNDPPR